MRRHTVGSDCPGAADRANAFSKMLQICLSIRVMKPQSQCRRGRCLLSAAIHLHRPFFRLGASCSKEVFKLVHNLWMFLGQIVLLADVGRQVVKFDRVRFRISNCFPFIPTRDCAAGRRD